VTIAEGLVHHLERPLGRGHRPENSCTGAAGGAACGDLIRISIAIDPDSADGRIEDVGFDASGCGATIAAGSAAVALARDRDLLDVARIGPAEIAAELGGLSPAKLHAAELAADALHRALGSAARHDTALAPAPGRTLVAMSGGVDSAVAALLVSEQGAEAVAVTLELWADPANDAERSCCSAAAVRGARAVAHELGLPHLSIDLRAEFAAGVVQPWLEDHAAGLTPNPCVRCNGQVRLDAMLELGSRLGASELATGHYARISRETPPLLRVAADPAKDQTYMLAGLSPASLARLRFPLGELSKPQVRELAAAHALPVAAKPDSQDLCFLAGVGHEAFLDRHGGLGERSGPILDEDGHVLGTHRGHHRFTVGQRRGLGVGAVEPLYVLATDAGRNSVIVGPRARLATTRVLLRDATLHRDSRAVDRVRLRYRHRALPGRLAEPAAAGRHGHLAVALEEPMDGVAPGQLACLMAGDVIVGHGTIAAWPADEANAD
jgi:tRNA-uridine 2-sulfurtransferase